jgi:hypothetical protein
VLVGSHAPGDAVHDDADAVFAHGFDWVTREDCLDSPAGVKMKVNGIDDTARSLRSHLQFQLDR